MSRQVVVEEETDEIADGVGHIDIDPMLQHPVDDIVDHRCNDAHHAKPQNLAKCLFSVHKWKNTLQRYK